MKDGSAAVEKEALDYVERGWSGLLEDAEAKGLGDGRVDAVEDGVCAGAFDPSGTAAREETAPCFGVLKTGVAFGAVQTFRECEVREVHRSDYAHGKAV